MMEPSFVFFNGILVTPDKISMVEGRTEVITVRKADIKKVSLGFGYQAERPVVQVVFGIVLFLIAAYPILRLYSAWMGYLRMYAMEFMLLGLIPLGIWMIRSALKYGYYLSIELENDHRKLGFQNECQEDDLKEFFKQIAILGYRSDTSEL